MNTKKLFAHSVALKSAICSEIHPPRTNPITDDDLQIGRIKLRIYRNSETGKREVQIKDEGIQPHEDELGYSQHPFDNVDEGGESESSKGYPSTSNHGSTEASGSKLPNIPLVSMTPEQALAQIQAENRKLKAQNNALLEVHKDLSIKNINLSNDHDELVGQVSKLEGEKEVLLEIIEKLGKIFNDINVPVRSSHAAETLLEALDSYDLNPNARRREERFWEEGATSLWRGQIAEVSNDGTQVVSLGVLVYPPRLTPDESNNQDAFHNFLEVLDLVYRFDNLPLDARVVDLLEAVPSSLVRTRIPSFKQGIFRSDTNALRRRRVQRSSRSQDEIELGCLRDDSNSEDEVLKGFMISTVQKDITSRLLPVATDHPYFKAFLSCKVAGTLEGASKTSYRMCMFCWEATGSPHIPRDGSLIEVILVDDVGTLASRTIERMSK
ncbi:hypothetical protein F5878DRAFT_645413 [Lentinula raphanica]|uniref:Uncharacterized protein n=1 Tax=Lentinula raphanica TaxID=153919 RepID=A0AA38UDB2_9AGAR|nr:hypothetical protein EV360DRAFT_72943 [Lentinula raphanica]KAJ3834092.1 hypothetical protein F5878DRAFT_645413 [Lentinula raphanica]